MKYKNHACARVLALLLCLLCLASCLASCGGNNDPAPPAVTVPNDPALPEFDPADLQRVIDQADYNKLYQVQNLLSQYYVSGTYRPYAEVTDEVVRFLIETFDLSMIQSADDATTVLINSYLNVLGDQYGYYYDAASYEDYSEDMSGEYVGIGVSVILDKSGYIEVITVFKDSPAEQAGILPGDMLTHVEGEDIAMAGYYESIAKVKGEEGTTVHLTLSRDGESVEVEAVRAKVTEYTVSYEMLEDNIGYIHISSFDDGTYRQFVAAYEDLIAQGMQSVLFDLRNNPGGTLTSIVAILEYILPDGPIAHMVYKDETMNYTIESIFDVSIPFMFFNPYYDAHQVDLPVVVLANGNTASAAELFTSSLKDYGVATVVGDYTYGKGVGQRGFSLKGTDGKEDGSAVNITIFYYDPPFTENYNGVGIKPDVEISLSEEASKKNLYKLTAEEDVQKQAGLKILQEKSEDRFVTVN